jgi:hypothetical protein
MQRNTLYRFVDEGWLKPDNGAVKNAIHPLPWGGKAGSLRETRATRKQRLSSAVWCTPARAAECMPESGLMMSSVGS